MLTMITYLVTYLLTYLLTCKHNILQCLHKLNNGDAHYAPLVQLVYCYSRLLNKEPKIVLKQ